MRPLVVACVAPADLMPEVDRLTGEVRSDLRRADLTASDAAAVEHALQIAGAWQGRALVVAAGPPAVDPVLVGLGALGCEVVRVGHSGHGDPEAAGGPRSRSAPDLAGDAREVARQLAWAIMSKGQPSLVVCGDRSADHGVGAVPSFLAHELGLEQALGLVALSTTGPDRLRAERRLDGGWRERLEIGGPAVVSIEAAGVRLRRAGLAAALAAEPGAVQSFEAGAELSGALHFGPPVPYRPRPKPIAAPVGDPHQRLVALTGALSNREPPKVVGPLDGPAAADEVLDFLRRSGVPLD